MENRYKFENIEDIKRFLIGGKSILTLESNKTGRWFTYKIVKSKSNDSLFFVSVLTGMNNESAYSYLGTIFNNDGKFKFTLTKKSNIGEDAFSYKAFNFFFNDLMNNKIHSDLSVYHKGVCGRCGRTLTVPESLVNGFGPECLGLTNKKLKTISHS
jgi:hypothetical protein